MTVLQKNLRLVYVLFVLASMCIVLWQSTRSTPLIDYSYQVENAYRIYRGQTPYRDFFLVVSPGTYFIMAFIMSLTGGYIHWVSVLHTMLIAAGICICTYWIIRMYIRDPFLSLLLCLPLLFSGPSIYPYPLYDSHAVLSILMSLWMLLWLFRHTSGSVYLYVLAGLLCVVPLYMKQNMGVVYMGLVFLFAVVSLFYNTYHKRSIHKYMALLFGILCGVSVTLFWLFTTGAFDHAVFQLFTFPRFSKNPIDGIRVIQYELTVFFNQAVTYIRYLIPLPVLYMIGTRVLRGRYIQSVSAYSRVWSVSIALIGTALFILSLDKSGVSDMFILHWWGYLSISFVLLLLILTISRFRSIELHIVVITSILLLVSYATFLSHGIVGSSNAIWPFSIILLALNIYALRRVFPLFPWYETSIGFVWILTLVLGYRVVIQKNMDYVFLDGNPDHGRINSLVGLSTPGSWLKQFEALLTYVETHIPQNESVAFLPGEDPFFAASGRINPLQFSLLHASVFTLQPHMIVTELLSKKVQWIIIKQSFQTKPQAWFSNIVEITGVLSEYYTPEFTLDNYTLYKRKPL